MDAALGLPILITLIAVALAFDFLNGLHDAANSIATIVSTRVLRPRYAVCGASKRCSSPDACISRMMSQPPTNSPLT